MFLVVLTSARKNNYLEKTLDCINKQTWRGKKILWSDGELPETKGTYGWKIIVREKQGPPNTFAFWDMLNYCNCECEDILFFEDDILLSKNCLEYIQKIGCPEPYSYISWYDGLFKPTIVVPKIWNIDGSEIISCQARTIPIRTIEYLCKYRYSDQWEPRYMSGSDAVMAKALKGKLAGIHVPSLVQHIGEESLVMPEGSALMDYRVSATWKGEEFDIGQHYEASNPNLFSFHRYPV